MAAGEVGIVGGYPFVEAMSAGQQGVQAGRTTSARQAADYRVPPTRPADVPPLRANAAGCGAPADGSPATYTRRQPSTR